MYTYITAVTKIENKFNLQETSCMSSSHASSFWNLYLEMILKKMMAMLYWGLTHKKLETHDCALSTVAADALVLLNQTLSNYSAEYIFIVLDQSPAEISQLTHWGRDKIDAISQTTFWSAFPWIKMFEFRLKFHWNLIVRVQLTIFQHWFR